MISLSKYLVYYGLTVKISLNYRMNLLFQFLGNLVAIALLIFIWKSINGVDTQTRNIELFSVLLSTEILLLCETWLEYDFESKVKRGDILVDFGKPINIFGMTFFKNLGFVTTNLLVIIVPFVILIIFGISESIISPINIGLFIIALLNSLMINFFMSLFIGIWAISLKSVWGVLIFKELLITLFSGILIPINLYPKIIQSIAKLLPIYGIFQVPKDIILGNFTTPSYLFIYQLVWIIILVIFCNKLFLEQLQKITFFGG